jgi:hypothetical protein
MKRHLQALGARHLDAGSLRKPSIPIPPEERISPDGAGIQEQAHLARRGGGVALPLARFAKRTGMALADASSRDQTQTPLSFWTPLVHGQGRSSRAAQRPIGLESTVGAREATSVPGRGDRGGRRALWESRSSDRPPGCRRTRGAANRIRTHLMVQFQLHVPDPWTDDLPCLMPTRALPTPPIGTVLLIFLSQRRFTRSTMQRQRRHISSRESGRRHSGQELFVEHTSAHHATPVCRCTCWMRGTHHAGTLLAACVQGLIRAIGMWAHDPTFRVGEPVIGMECASGLNGGVIQDAIVCAACDRAHVGEIHENRCDAIWTIHSHDGIRDRQIADVRRSLDDRERVAQFDARLAVTSMAKAGEPVVSPGREHGGPRSCSLSVRASGVVWCVCRAHASGWIWPILGLWQGPRAHGLMGTINIEDADKFALLVELSTRWLLLRERPREQVVEEERAQGFHGALIEGGEKATDRRTSEEAII